MRGPRAVGPGGGTPPEPAAGTAALREYVKEQRAIDR
jgi:hypothetical protein